MAGSYPLSRRPGGGPASLMSPGARAVLPLAAVLTLVAALAAVSVWLAAGVFLQGAPAAGHEHSHAQAFAVGQPLPTSFGTVTVTHVEQIDGLTADQTGGITGMQGRVKDGEVQVQASVRLTNQQRRPVDYTLRQFRLITETSDAPIPLKGATASDGTLPPSATIEATFSFIAPRDAGHLWLEYGEPDGDELVRVALGQTDQPPANPSGGQHNHTHTHNSYNGEEKPAP